MVALAVGGLGTVAGFDRERSFYPTALIVIAFYYVLFAAMGAPGETLGVEMVIALGFTALAVIGFRRNLLLVAAAIGGHGVFDWVRPAFLENAGMPVWWPGFCGSADVVLGMWLGMLLFRRGAWGLRKATAGPEG